MQHKKDKLSIGANLWRNVFFFKGDGQTENVLNTKRRFYGKYTYLYFIKFLCFKICDRLVHELVWNCSSTKKDLPKTLNQV